MRKILFLLLSTFIFLISLYPQATKTEQESVNQVLIKFFDGISALDLKLMQQCVTNDFLLLEGGDVWNMDTIAVYLKRYETGSFSRINALHFIRTEVNGNIAWVAYNNAAEIINKEEKRSAKWLESAVLIRAGNEWKIQLLHSTPLNRSPN